MPRPLVVFVDVDDTLVRHLGGKQIPVPGVIRHVRDLHESGATLYCWSTGGAEYARAMAGLVGLEACFTAFLPKPNVLLDDQAVRDWRQCVEVTPSETSGRAPGDYDDLLGR